MSNEPECVHRILNLGAGVQSTTVYLMYVRGEIQPGIECAIFADTGEEPASVYAHLEWLKSLGGPPIIVRSIGRLGDDLTLGRNSTGGRFASIPAFTAAVEGLESGNGAPRSAPRNIRSMSLSGACAVNCWAFRKANACRKERGSCRSTESRWMRLDAPFASESGWRIAPGSHPNSLSSTA